MATRLGIELSPTACRLVEIDASARLRPAAGTRVRSFAVMPPSGPDTDALLASMKGKSAAVVVWSAASDHRQVIVTDARYETMRSEALQALATAGVPTRGVAADIAAVEGHAPRRSRRPVVVALADASLIAAEIDPLVRAGIRVRSVVTPAVALASIARARRATSAQAGIEAYVVIEESTTCVALMREGVLTIARELNWGFVADAVSGDIRPRADIASRLAIELDQFFDALGRSAKSATQVCVCGGVPDLRSMTVPLMERLDVEVEPLDSLFGIKAAGLPEPEDEFRDRIAELRMAWAAAADWPPYINLLRTRRREETKRRFAAAAVVAGVAAGLGGAWGIARTIHPSAPAPKPAARTASARVTPPPVAMPVVKAPVAPPPLAARRTVATSTRSLVRPLTPVPLPLPAPAPVVAAVPPPPVQERPALRTTPPVRPQTAAASRPPSSATVRGEVAAPREPPRPALRTSTAPRPVPSTPAPKPEPVLPFDADLGTILYSSDRKLAIVDGRIVGIGDVVRGARIVEITPTAVMLRDPRGALRQLTLSGGLRSR